MSLVVVFIVGITRITAAIEAGVRLVDARFDRLHALLNDLYAATLSDDDVEE